ncbi:MAG TPA: hypothetical protein PK504_09500 [Ferruginibacter sp.]|nr:hypothetical protein [Ferruginibacter sp.]HRE63389.1 hypothetical protein [Ferruginibacter sp.]
MKKFLLSFTLTVISICAFAQEEISHANSTYNKSFIAELGGPGILFSANMDFRFKKNPLGLGGRIGLGFVTADEQVGDPNNYDYRRRSVITVPVQLNYLFGKPNSVNAFEVGFGITYIGKKLDIMDYYENEATQVFGTASFMYRRMPKDGGFSWRIGFTPLIANGIVQPFGAVSVGYNF